MAVEITKAGTISLGFWLVAVSVIAWCLAYAARHRSDYENFQWRHAVQVIRSEIEWDLKLWRESSVEHSR